jgi:non-ribosomal peptide synthetase component F
MLLLTAWEIGLWSLSGQVDLVMGTSISTREEATRHVMGLFANQLVLRTDLAGAASAREALQRARQAVLAAYEMRDVPFDLLVQRLRVPRDPGRTPLVRCNLVLQAGAGSGLALDGLQVETLPVDRGTSKLDLLLDVERRGGRLGGFLEYSTELFEPRAAEVLLGRFKTALEALAADIDVTLSELRERLDAAHPLAAEVGVSRSLLRARRRAVPLASQGEAAAG